MNPNGARLWVYSFRAVAGGCAALYFAVSTAQAAGCDPLMANRRAVVDQVIALHGGQRVTQPINVPAAATLLIVARERGVDAVLELVSADRRVLARADSSIQRAGVQRLSYATSAAAELILELAGKERAEVSGQVRLRAFLLSPGEPPEGCLDLQRQLAAADGAYAMGLALSGQSGLNARHGTDNWEAATRLKSASPPGDATERFQSATHVYQSVAQRLGARGDSAQLQAETQLDAAQVLYYHLSDWAAARVWADKASAAFAAAGDVYRGAIARAASAAALMEVATSLPSLPGAANAETAGSAALARARAALSAVAELHRRRQEPYEQALAINNIGLALYYEDRSAEALVYYRRALGLYEHLHEHFRRAQVLNNIALAEYELGQTAESSRHYSDMLALISPEEDTALYAAASDNKALADRQLGRLDAALQDNSQALDLWRALQDRRSEAYSLQGIGQILLMAGDQDQALGYLREALAIRTAALDGKGRVESLRAVAGVLRQHGNAAGAMTMDEEALALTTFASTRARIELQIAADLQLQGRQADAEQLVDTVIGEPTSDQLSAALARLERARLRNDSGATPAAEQDLHSAIATFQRYYQAEGEFTAWVELARARRHAGKAALALAAADTALQLAEEIRRQSANPELRAGLLQKMRPAFDLKIALLADAYFDPAAAGDPQQRKVLATEALQVAEQMRARALADYSSLDFNRSSQSRRLAQQRQKLLQLLAAQRSQLDSRLDRAGVSDTRAKVLAGAIATSRRQLAMLDAKLATASTTTRASVRPALSAPAVAVGRIPAGTIAVEYWLGQERALAWTLSQQQISLVDLGPSSAIDQAARAFHDALRSLNEATPQQRTALSERLYGLVIGPIAERLRGRQALVIAADGALHYTPFSTLRSPASGRYLVEDYIVSTTPAVGKVIGGGTETQRAGADRFLLVDDPVYESSDERLSNAGAVSVAAAPIASTARPVLRGAVPASDWQRLPGTATEAQSIAALLPPAQLDWLEGLAATRSKFLSAPLGRYRYIHIASHGLVDAEAPQLSSLVLSTRDERGQPIEGRVLAADLVTARINATAVVLSACDTALGKNVAGEGLVGLRYVLLARGARAVVASLWPVSDQASGRQMSVFYQQLLQRRQSPSAALSYSMRALFASGLTDPALWGAFDTTVSNAAFD